MKKKTMRAMFHCDSRPYTIGKAVRAKGIKKCLIVETAGSGAEDARQRMLERMGLDQDESTSAAAARERMIQRGEKGAAWLKGE